MLEPYSKKYDHLPVPTSKAFATAGHSRSNVKDIRSLSNHMTHSTATNCNCIFNTEGFLKYLQTNNCGKKFKDVAKSMAADTTSFF